MFLNEIISNAMDLAGGLGVGYKANAATLYALNVIADMELELQSSSRGRQSSVASKTFTAGSRTGTLSVLPTYIRFRENFGDWRIIEIVADIEDLTQAENENRRAILFFGENPYSYQLSFVPAFDIIAELWNPNASAQPANLSAAVPKIPAAYTNLAANRTAILLLDDALLMPNADKLTAFIQSRKSSLFNRQRDLEHRWAIYRSNADNSLADSTAYAYDPFAAEEYGSIFEIN